MRNLYMSTERFVDHVKAGYDSDLRYCFILGSGASYTSGIPTGLKLMPEWREYLLKRGMGYIRECAKDCGISNERLEEVFNPDYQLKSDDYFTLFDLRFAGMPVVAYRYLQNLMENAEPSIGYYMLAVLMDNTENKLVITTNFDTLVEDVLYMYHAKHPLVAGHESLAPFIGTAENMGRPVVAKVHRDMTLHPLNREIELQKLAEDWAENLRTAFSHYIPIVIGYSGGDQTLMNLLEKSKLDCIYWCSLNNCETERIESLLQECPRGYLVKIKGFDDLMFKLVSKMMEGQEFAKPAERMKTLFETRINNYNKQYYDIEHKFAEEETVQSSGQHSIDDSESSASTKGIPTSESVVSSAKSELELLDKMASSDDSRTSNVAALRRRAVKSYLQGGLEQAIKYCNDAIEIEPKEADLHSLKSGMLYNAGLYEEALEEIDKAVDLEPDNAKYHYSRSMTLHKIGRSKDALEEIDKAVDLEPDNAEYHYSRGVMLQELELYEEALKEIDKAVELEPNNALYHDSRSTTFHELGLYEEALKEINEAVKLEPNNALYHYSRSMTLYKSGRYKYALEEIDKAVDLEPNNALYHYFRGVTLQELDLYEESLKEFNKAVKLEPNNALYHCALGTTLLELDRYKDALEEIDKVVELEPNNALYHYTRGVILQKLGRYEEALKEDEEAVRLKRDNAQSNNNRK